MCAEQHGFRSSGGARHESSGRAGDGSLGRALALVRFLRERCPWDARQTPATLRPYLLEEAHETAEAISRGDDSELSGELGDLLLNLAFQIVLAEERGAFDAPAVVERLEEKMRRRHPHVYGEAEAPPDWEALKAEERAAAAAGPPDAAAHGGSPRVERGRPAEGSPLDPFAGVPAGLDALDRSARFQERAAGLNFDWPSARGALAKLREEAEELSRLLPVEERGTGAADATRPGAAPEVAEEVGDLLFAAVNVARLAGVHPAVALEGATAKFAARFRRLLALAAEAGLDPRRASLEELDGLWERTKEEERGDAEPAAVSRP